MPPATPHARYRWPFPLSNIIIGQSDDPPSVTVKGPSFFYSRWGFSIQRRGLPAGSRYSWGPWALQMAVFNIKLTTIVTRKMWFFSNFSSKKRALGVTPGPPGRYRWPPWALQMAPGWPKKAAVLR